MRPHTKRKLASIRQRNSVDVSFRVVPAAPSKPAAKPAPLYTALPENTTATPPVAATSQRASSPVQTPNAGAPVRAVGPINAKYTFDSFVVGKHNRIAFAAAEDIARCLLYTSDAADERSSVDLGGRRIIKKKTNDNIRGDVV